MRFLAPHLLHLAWLALIPLALYLFKKKARRVPVSTLLFFRSLAREHQESAWLRKLKKWLSLLLTLLMLFLIVLALARPVGEAGAESPGAVVLLVDRSASMAARDEKGRTRLEEARALARSKLKSLPEQVVVSLVACDAKAHVLLSRSRNRRECLRLLDELQPRPLTLRADLALVTAARLAELEPGTQVWHFGDRAFEPGANLAYQFHSAALDAPLNAGITAFQIRPAPLAHDRYEAFVKVTAAPANTRRVTSTLEVTLAGRLAQLRELELEPGESSALILPLEGVKGQRMTVQLKTPGDCLGWDDAVAAVLPRARPLVVAWVAENADPFTELALTSMIEAGRIEMLRGTPAAWPMSDKPDVYVFEQWLPDPWPADRPVIVLNPPKSAGPVQVRRLTGAGLPHESVRTAAPEHPVLFRVSSSRLAITQTGVLDTGTSLEPLWMAGNEPVLAAGEVEGQRLVISAFSPARSEQLALLPAFPLMLGNALYWCAEQAATLTGVQTRHPGDLMEEEGLLRWTEWDGTRFIETTEVLQGGITAITRLGAWENGDDRTGVSALASAAETSIPARAVESAPASTPLPAFAAGPVFRDWPAILTATLLFLLLLESWLFHRKAVY